MDAVRCRCGSSLGAEDVVLDFFHQGDGKVVARSGKGAPASNNLIKELSGQLSATQLSDASVNGRISVVMQFVKNDEGTLYYATERKWKTGRSRSTINPVPR